MDADGALGRGPGFSIHHVTRSSDHCSDLYRHMDLLVKSEGCRDSGHSGHTVNNGEDNPMPGFQSKPPVLFCFVLF